MILKRYAGSSSRVSLCVPYGEFDGAGLPIDHHSAEILFGERFPQSESVLFASKILVRMRESTGRQLMER